MYKIALKYNILSLFTKCHFDEKIVVFPYSTDLLGLFSRRTSARLADVPFVSRRRGRYCRSRGRRSTATPTTPARYVGLDLDWVIPNKVSVVRIRFC